MLMAKVTLPEALESFNVNFKLSSGNVKRLPPLASLKEEPSTSPTEEYVRSEVVIVTLLISEIEIVVE